jgi:hypothetical protein
MTNAVKVYSTFSDYLETEKHAETEFDNLFGDIPKDKDKIRFVLVGNEQNDVGYITNALVYSVAQKFHRKHKREPRMYSFSQQIWIGLVVESD